MAQDPICGMEVAESPDSIQAKKASRVYYFCSEHCRGKFLGKPWYKDLSVLAFLAAAVLLLGSLIFPPLVHFRRAFFDYGRMLAIPIALGFLIGGVMDHYIPDTYITKFLAAHKKRTIFYAAGLGFLMTACSHGIIALSMELHKKGASGPAVVSFLLASPWANLPITFLLIGFFGWKGFLIIFSALLIAVVTGLLMQVLDRKGWIEKNPRAVRVPEDFSIRKNFARRFRRYRFSISSVVSDLKGILKGIRGLIDMVLGWVLIGMILAGLASAFVPTHIFERLLGPSPLGLLATLILATVLEVCSEGTSPLAFEIYRKTGAFGNAFAFLMGGVVTDYTEVGLIWKNIGKKTALWMLALTLPQVLLLAATFNFIFAH